MLEELIRIELVRRADGFVTRSGSKRISFQKIVCQTIPAFSKYVNVEAARLMQKGSSTYRRHHLLPKFCGHHDALPYYVSRFILVVVHGRGLWYVEVTFQRYWEIVYSIVVFSDFVYVQVSRFGDKLNLSEGAI